MNFFLRLLIFAAVFILSETVSCMDWRTRNEINNSRIAENLFHVMEIRETGAEQQLRNLIGYNGAVRFADIQTSPDIPQALKDKIVPGYSLLSTEIYCKVKITGNFGWLRRWWSRRTKGTPRQVILNPRNPLNKLIFPEIANRKEVSIEDLDDIFAYFLEKTGVAYEHFTPGDDLCFFTDGTCIPVI